MDKKINYHLTSLLAEIKSAIIEEISAAIKQTLAESKSELFDKPNVILKIDEVVKEFRISKSHINKLRESNKDFPVIYMGNSVRFNKKELEDFFKNKDMNKVSH